MPAPASPESYPAVFHLLLTHFAEPDAKPVAQHYPRSQDAATVRFRFYSFRNSLGRAGRTEEQRVAEGILARIIPDSGAGTGATLEFSHRDNEKWALGLEAALSRAQDSAVRGQAVGSALGGEEAGAGISGGESATPSAAEALTEAFMRKGEDAK